MVDLTAVLTALRLPAETAVEAEPLGLAAGSAVRLEIRAPGGAPRTVLLRTATDAEALENNAAVLEALGALGYGGSPRLLAIGDGFTVEEWVEGATTMALAFGKADLEAAISALATLHALPVREGVRWERPASELVPAVDLQLYRLGFGSEERDAAAGPLAELRAEVAASPGGFGHGHAVAARVLMNGGRAWLVNFGAAGHGLHLVDVAAFLTTAGLEAPVRRRLAEQYARLRNLEPGPAADLTDATGLLWGLDYLLGLPRRLVESLGDDVVNERNRLEAARIEESFREPAGSLPAAAALRRALWG